MDHLTIADFLGAQFLASADAAEARSEQSQKRMARLNPQQFQVFAQDIVDEILRRRDSNAPPHLAARSDFNDKRNQTRKKLATLAHINFCKMACDVLLELERRVPSLSSSIQVSSPPTTPHKEVHIPPRTPLSTTAASIPYDLNPPSATPAPTPNRAVKQKQSIKSIDDVLSELEGLGMSQKNHGVDQVGDSNSVLKEAMERLRKDTQSKLDASAIRIKDLESQLSVAQKEVSAAKTEVNEVGDEYLNAMKEVENLQRKLNSTSTTAQTLEKDLSTLQTAHTETLARAETLQTQVTHLQKHQQSDKSKEAIAAAEAETSRLRERVRELESEISRERDALGRKERECVEVKEGYTDLKAFVSEQQLLFNEVQSETSSLLTEIKQLTAKNKKLGRENESLISQHQQSVQVADGLSQQYDEMVRNFEALKSENEILREKIQELSASRKPKASPFPASKGPASAPSTKHLLPLNRLSHNGVLNMATIKAYNSSIESLVQNARNYPQTQVTLISLKSVISMCKQITQNIEDYESNHSNSASSSSIDVSRTEFSTALSTLMSTIKKHMKPHRGSDSDEENQSESVQRVYESVNALTQAVETVSANVNGHSKKVAQTHHLTDSEDDKDVLDSEDGTHVVKQYLGNNTHVITTSIRNALTLMRNNTNPDDGQFLKDVSENILVISNVILQLIQVSRKAFESVEEERVRVEGVKVVSKMVGLRKEMIGVLGELGVDPGSGEVRKQLGGVAYELVKEVKQLGLLLE